MTAEDHAAHRSLRLDPWPSDASISHLVVLDQHVVPTEADLGRFVDIARTRGHRRVRTSALFPAAAEAVCSTGFRVVDTLALLHLDLRAPTTARRPDSPAARRSRDHRVRRLLRRDDPYAAEVDRVAFGAEWGNDTDGIRAIRTATPRHRARCVRDGSALVGFAIGGVGARSGYLQRLAVHPEHRRRRIAGALVDDLVRWFSALGLDEVLVNTGVDNTGALALYRARGFAVLDHRLVVAELDLHRDVDDASALGPTALGAPATGAPDPASGSAPGGER